MPCWPEARPTHRKRDSVEYWLERPSISCEVIAKLMTSILLPPRVETRSGGLTVTFALSSILHPDLVKVPLEGTTKRETIDELCTLLCSSDSIQDPENFRRTVWDREGQRSTGIGEGLAIPHGKCAGVREITMAIGLPTEPIEFDSIDGRPVKMIVLLASPANRIADHIQALGRISKFMADPTIRERAFDAPDAESLYELLAGLDTATRS